MVDHRQARVILAVGRFLAERRAEGGPFLAPFRDARGVNQIAHGLLLVRDAAHGLLTLEPVARALGARSLSALRLFDVGHGGMVGVIVAAVGCFSLDRERRPFVASVACRTRGSLHPLDRVILAMRGTASRHGMRGVGHATGVGTLFAAVELCLSHHGGTGVIAAVRRHAEDGGREPDAEREHGSAFGAGGESAVHHG